MLINFEKMQGLGNDFVVIDLITQNVRFETEQIQRIADRHFGIGCDQVILLEPPIRPNADFFYRVYNADGQEVEQCGNGARCAARFFFDSGFARMRNLEADCLAGPIQFTIEEDESVSVNMGKPSFSPSHIPLNLTEELSLYALPLNDFPLMQEANKLLVKVQQDNFYFSALAIGNPHAILQVNDIEKVPVAAWGNFISKHPLFPKETNVEFMQIVDENRIRLRVYERGVGETLACGTGASAAAVAGIRLQTLKNPVNVVFGTGELQIQWSEMDSSIIMKGPATSVFAGRFRI